MDVDEVLGLSTACLFRPPRINLSSTEPVMAREVLLKRWSTSSELLHKKPKGKNNKSRWSPELWLN